MIGAFAQGAPALLQGGYSPIPVHFGTRRPMIRWERCRQAPLTSREASRLATRHPHLSLAVAGGYRGLVPVDCDTDDEAIIGAITSALPEPNVVKAGRRGFTGYFRDPTSTIGGRKFQTPAPDRRVLVELLPTGQTLIPPTIHPSTGKPYRWLTPRTLFDTPIEDLVPITSAHVAELEHAMRPWVPERPVYTPLPPSGELVTEQRMRAYAQRALDGEAHALRSTHCGGRNPQLFTAACKLGKYVHHRVLAQDEILTALLDACRENGLIADDGIAQCRATFESGLRKSVNDPLPTLRSSETRLCD
jgi:hypothetical protein